LLSVGFKNQRVSSSSESRRTSSDHTGGARTRYYGGITNESVVIRA